MSVSIAGRKVWVDLEHQKAGIMLAPLFKQLEAGGAELLYTARDFGNNRQVLEELGIRFTMVGSHGGADLAAKLATHVERVRDLLPIVTGFRPDFSISFCSVEHARVAFGLRIPSVAFNDEPRSTAVGRLTLPLLDHVITPSCIPIDWYLALGASRDRLIRYNGIDEIAWLSAYKPDPSILDVMDVDKGMYVLMRTEMTHAEYLREKMKPEDTAIADFLPAIVKEFPNHKFFLLCRSPLQEAFLERRLRDLDGRHVIITRFIPRLDDFMFFSALVASGGGTIVRESSLLGVPSIEFFPGETAPQEHFLMDNGFPLWHLKTPAEVAARAIQVLHGEHGSREGFHARLARFDNPATVCHDHVVGRLERA